MSVAKGQSVKAECILRAYGSCFIVNEFLAESNLDPCKEWNQGEYGHKKINETSGLCVFVSTGTGDALADQIRGAIKFLAKNHREIEQLCQYPGVESVFLDFSVFRRDVVAEYIRFPAKLIQLAGGLGIGIELSQYQSVE